MAPCHSPRPDTEEPRCTFPPTPTARTARTSSTWRRACGCTPASSRSAPGSSPSPPAASPAPTASACAPPARASDETARLAGEDGAVLVQLEDLHGVGRRRVEAELAQHALVDVLLDDLDGAVLTLRVDVDGADLGEPGGERGVLRRLVVDLDADEDRVLPHAALRSPRRSRTRSGIWEISSATTMPASARRAIFSVAVSSLPSTMLPAWPKLMPGISSMKRPAMNATIGRRESLSLTHSASWASMRPPGSV